MRSPFFQILRYFMLKRRLIESVFLLPLLVWGLVGHAQNSPVTSAQQQRMARLYQMAERDLLPLPLPEVPPCTADRFLKNTHLAPDTKTVLAEVAALREKGASACALQMLQAIKSTAQRKEADHIQWLYELTCTLTLTEQLDSALVTARQLTLLAERIGQFQGLAWLTEAQARHSKRQFNETLRLAEQSLGYARKYSDKALEARALDIIGGVSRDIYMTRPEKSVQPLLDALDIAQTLRDTEFVVRCLVRLSLHYLDTDLNRSLDYMEQVMAFPQASRSPHSHHITLRELGYFFQISQDFEQSNQLLDRSAAFGKRLGLRSSVQNDYEQMSDNHMALGDAARAQACLDSAYLYCNFQRELGYFYQSFAEVAAMRGDWPKSFEWYQKAFDEQVKGYNNRITEQLTEQETRFRTHELELQAEEQKRLRRLWFGLSLALAGLLAVAAYAFFQQRKIRRQLAAQNALIERQAAELYRLDEAKSRFFANASHELRTPLTLLLGPLGTMLKSTRLDARDASLAHVAQQHAQQLLRLVNEILDLSKMESGKMRLRETAISLQPFLRRSVSAFESHAERLGIDFTFEYRPTARLRVLVDEDKLQKVINNLLSNAFKFTPPNKGNAVSVRVEETENCVRLVVSDTGRGIHPEDLPHIFERFYQTRQVGGPVEGGTGIGLALCREFADIMGGKIWAESPIGASGANQGAAFFFEFPKKEVLGVSQVSNEELAVGSEGLAMSSGAAGRANNPMPDDSMTNDETPRPTVLLVEDNDSLRDYVQMILGEKYRVITATHGQEAIDFLNSDEAQSIIHSPSFIIISDVMMPVMDGFQLVEKLKADDHYRHIPVVMLTARADLRDKLKALRIGVDDYLLKPFEEEELLVRVENLLKNHRQRGSNEQPTVDNEPSAVGGDARSLTAQDLAWLSDLEKTVEQSLGGPNLSADALADAMYMSRTKFFQQVKRLTGMTPNEYVLEVRFAKARTLLENRSATTVKSAAGSVGFRDVEYFSKQFRARFGKVPSEYLG